MTAQEILDTKEVFNIKDIMILYQCKEAMAYKIIKAIRSVSDRLELNGRVHKKDYFDYINRFDTKKRVVEEPEKFDNYSYRAK